MKFVQKHERNNEIATMRKAGKTVREIAQKFSISNNRVKEILARYGLNRLPKGRSQSSPPTHSQN